MTETVVHVTTLYQWKSVLDVWFEKGYEWYSSKIDYKESYFMDENSYYLVLTATGDIARCSEIYSSTFIEYSEFMKQQKEGNKMETYYVAQEQLDLIQELKSYTYPLDTILRVSYKYSFITTALNSQVEKALLRYLGGDETVEFKLKEQLYRLWRIDDEGDKVYMTFNLGTPDWDSVKDYAFTAPLEEIKKHKTISWEIEEVK